MPWLSVPGTWRLVVWLLIGLGLLAWILDLKAGWRSWFARLVLPALCVTTAGWLISTTGPTSVWRHSGIGAGRSDPPLYDLPTLHEWCNQFNRSIVWQRDGRESAIALHAEQSLSLMVNGKSDGNAMYDAGTQIMLGILGPLLHPNPQTGIVVGLGTGETAGWMAEVPTIQRVDVVELEPSVDEMARRWPR